MLVKLSFFFLTVLVLQCCGSPSRVRRQGFSWGDNSDFSDVLPTARPRPPTRFTTQTTTANGRTTTTTPTPTYAACIRQCPTTPQYNPICGNNGVTYSNESHLRCANRCGLSVRRAFSGTCQPL